MALTFRNPDSNRNFYSVLNSQQRLIGFLIYTPSTGTTIYQEYFTNSIDSLDIDDLSRIYEVMAIFDQESIP